MQDSRRTQLSKYESVEQEREGARPIEGDGEKGGRRCFVGQGWQLVAVYVNGAHQEKSCLGNGLA